MAEIYITNVLIKNKKKTFPNCIIFCCFLKENLLTKQSKADVIANCLLGVTGAPDDSMNVVVL